MDRNVRIGRYYVRMRDAMRRFGLLVALTLCLAPAAVAQVTIGSPAGACCNLQTFGKPDTETFGQTITTPGNPNIILESFSFWFGASNVATYNLDFRAFVYEWNTATNRAVGAALFASAVLNRTGTSASPNVQTTFNTGSLVLTPGNIYVLFVSTLGLPGVGTMRLEANNANAYAGGGVVFMNNAANTGAWTANQWGSLNNFDMHFEAQFSAVPEPSTWILLATGLLVLGIVARNRRREGIETHLA